jgi:hypothetical protein
LKEINKLEVLNYINTSSYFSSFIIKRILLSPEFTSSQFLADL